MSHEYTVALSLSGPGLDVDGLTRDLGLAPYRTSRGDDPLWMYDGGPGLSGRRWASLEEGLSRLLDELEPKGARLRQLAARHRVTWWCGSFQSGFDGGPTLSAALLARLGALGLPLALETYSSDPE